MAEIGHPNDPAEYVDGIKTQVQDEAMDGIQDDLQTTQAGEQPKSSGAEPRTEANREDSQDATDTSKEEEKPPPSKFKVLWGKLGLDPVTLILMFKGSLPPLIAVAFYQSPAVAATYGTLGFLVPIISVISMAILPRAKFVQTMILNIIGICLGSAIGLLGLWSSIQARRHTTPEGSKASYNSSQSVVCAIWLIFNIWAVNMLRAKYPVMQFPALVYSIFTNVAFSFGPVFQTMDQAEALIRQLLEGFLTAFAIATGVSLFVIPISSRKVVFGEMTGYIGAIRATIKAQTAYLESMEKSDMFAPPETKEGDDKEVNDNKGAKDEKPSAANHPQGKTLKASVAGLTALHGKLHGDLPFGKREIAYGKLAPEDLDALFKLFQAILIPLIGMSTITDIFERIAERRGWVRTAERSEFDDAEEWEHDPGEDAKKREKEVWNDVMKQLHCSFEVVSKAIDEGMEHAGILLEFIKPPKTKSLSEPEVDVEAKGDIMKPGDKGFSEYLDKKLADFYSKRGQTLKTWAKGRGLSAEKFDAAKSPGIDDSEATPDENHHRRDQQQLYLILYMEFLLYSTGSAILKFIRFAEEKVEHGTMKKNRLIHPGQRRIRKWILSLGTEDSTVDSNTPDSLEGASGTVYLGSGFNKKKDPEHLPATNAWEKFGNGVRTIPHFLGSVESAFGARVALATMTIGIVAFLETTQTFFLEQRLVWALIIVAISMTVTAGQSVFGLIARTGGTAIAMVISIVIWYLPDQHTAGAIVFLWLFIFIEYYFLIKLPRFVPVFIVCIVTQVLIVGYELQVEVIGIAAASALGQPYYPIYELAPYRLACVAGGCVVAFIWTIFPYPLTDGSWLRKDLGATIYLLANYYNIVHSTVHSRINRTEGNLEDKQSPGHKLEKVRHKIFGKLLLLLPSLREHADWQKWEPALGGKFPAETYNSIILRLTNIMNYMALIAYATQTWSTPSFPDEHSSTLSHHAWLEDLAVLLNEVGPTTHSFTSSLTLLSAAVTQGSALPPYMQLPEPYGLSKKLEKLDKGILDSRHVQEPGYSAYAVMQVASSLVTDDLKRLVEDVKGLVGEVDFSFKVVSSEDSSETDITPTESRKGKQD